MAYPALPLDYLNVSRSSQSSGSASSVEPITPELLPNPTVMEDEIACKWKGCEHVAPSADQLYDHLCNVHVGRKSTNNLCLTCGWEGCGVKCVKRDHITSHLRVHTPLKPHPCAVCGKTFKRPQDLKKHERIHTQEHHQLHKLSKATTSLDPAFNQRVTGGERRTSDTLSPLSASLSPPSSQNPTSPYENVLGYPPFVRKDSPTALAALHRKQHEELAAYQHREMLALQQLAMQQQQNQAYAAQLAGDLNFKAGQKRDLEDSSGFDGFFTDMKKRRMEPVYDEDMINRLNGMSMPSIQYPTFPTFPTQAPVMPEIKTEQELAMFNQFMISLGRDAAGGYGASMAHVPSYGSTSTGSPLSDQSPIEDLFNPDELASLGLTGMPGMNLDMNNVSFGNMYPTLDKRTHSFSEESKRPIASIPRHSLPGKAEEYFDSQYSFDSLARSKIAPQATLAPRDFYKKTYRHVAPLGTAVSARESSERTSVEQKMSVKNLLSDDLTLPALHRPLSREEPELPGVDEIGNLPTKRHSEDDIVRGVKRMELADPVSKSVRRRHAVIIRSWLVAVNLEYRRKKLEEMSELSDDYESDEETVSGEIGGRLAISEIAA